MKLVKYILSKLFIRSETSSIVLGPNQGRKMKGAQLSHIFGRTESHLVKAIRKHIKKGDCVFEIGANIGYFTIMLSQVVGKKGKVFAFEPIPSTFAVLKKNVDVNNCTNVTLVNKGVSDGNKLEEFRMIGDNHSMASSEWFKNEEKVSTLVIESIALDHSPELNVLQPNFIKIDVEGAEGKVIQGMKDVIKKNRPIIFIECSELGRKVTWEILTSLNYKCYFAKEMDRKSVINFSEYRHDDFLWIPG